MTGKNDHSFFHFTKKERNGILLLTAIIIVLIFLPRLYPFFIPKQHYTDTAFQNAIASLQTVEKDSGENSSYYDPSFKQEFYKNSKDISSADTKGELFPFDPNTLSANGWKRLGLRDKTIGTIQNYLDKGGRFRSPEDIHKIWGLRPGEANRLEPYVRITAPATPANTPMTTRPVYVKTPHVPAVIDINQADTSAFIALPGIGSKLANRIVSFRDKLGGFYAVDQVAETFGLADSTFRKIKPLLRTGSTVVKQVNINTATLEEMKQHPYIRYQLANAIVQYRQQHGAFAQADDIRNIMLVTEEMYKKLEPYLVVK